ncbi:HNH endonuclease [Denitrobaculum tricleocarpae]|nr:HNH endonuclease signature motif containing protein [Denitrobaculum tricleocarpae]
MAEQKFNYFERRALWEAHDKRCAYCRDPISFAEMEVDHVLPESLLNDEAEWAHVREEQGLLRDFSLRGYENLQPSCRACNSRKRAEVFPAGRTAIELGVTRKKKIIVEELVQRFRKADETDKLRFAIAGALGSGTISEEEVSETMAKARESSGVFRLSSVFKLFGDAPLRDISKSDYKHYLNTKISLPPEMENGLRLISQGGKEVYVTTLQEFQEAVDNSFYAYSNFEMSVEFQSFKRPLALLQTIKAAKVPEKSFIDNPRIGLSDISLLPATLLFLTEDMTNDPAFAGQREELKGRSIQDLVSSGDARVTRVGANSIGIDYDGGRTFMFELMRADVTGDGIQDMVIHWGAGVHGGTYGTASVLVLTRLTENEMFSVTRAKGASAHLQG